MFEVFCVCCPSDQSQPNLCNSALLSAAGVFALPRVIPSDYKHDKGDTLKRGKLKITTTNSQCFQCRINCQWQDFSELHKDLMLFREWWGEKKMKQQKSVKYKLSLSY